MLGRKEEFTNTVGYLVKFCHSSNNSFVLCFSGRARNYRCFLVSHPKFSLKCLLCNSLVTQKGFENALESPPNINKEIILTKYVGLLS